MIQERNGMAKLREQQYRIAAEAGWNAAATVARYEGGETRRWEELTVHEQNDRWTRIKEDHEGVDGGRPPEPAPKSEEERRLRDIRDDVTDIVLAHLDSSKGSQSDRDVG